MTRSDPPRDTARLIPGREGLERLFHSHIHLPSRREGTQVREEDVVLQFAGTDLGKKQVCTATGKLLHVTGHVRD